jgi:hypothetical protein
MNSRKAIFSPGVRYKCLKSIEAKLPIESAFSAGELLTFNRVQYSHYDALHSYTFLLAGQLPEKHWILGDDQDILTAKSYFEEIT